MKNYKCLLILLTLSAGLHTHAAITMNIDTGTKEIYFTGSDTATLSSFTGNGEMMWDNQNGLWDFVTVDYLTMPSSLLHYPDGSPAGIQLQVRSSGRLWMRQNLSDLPGQALTLTGTGVRWSYEADLLPALHSVFETYDNGPLNRAYIGSTSSSIAVNVIPEPSTAAFSVAAIGLLLLKRRMFM